jgi:hypothetical protein
MEISLTGKCSFCGEWMYLGGNRVIYIDEKLNKHEAHNACYQLFALRKKIPELEKAAFDAGRLAMKNELGPVLMGLGIFLE